jgi:hypothetical protein
MRLVHKIIAVGLCLYLFGCDDPKDDENKGGSVSAKLISSTFASAPLQLAAGLNLVNVTGKADSILLSGESDGGACGFRLWSAFSDSGKSGLEGRQLEAFDLGDPVSWSSLGAGLQGDCNSITVWTVEAYFMYTDLHLAVDGSDKVVRVYTGEQSPFMAGDLAFVEDQKLSWYDEDSDALVESTEDRPANPRTVDVGEVPWFDNNGTEKIVMRDLRIEVDKSADTVNADTGHVLVDVDFGDSSIAASDFSDDLALMKTLSLPFLESDDINDRLKATLTLFQDRPPGDEDEQGASN